MSDEMSARRANTSFYKDIFQMAFETADVMSFWWQPLVKGVGRAQLEIAGLQAKNLQAAMNWSRAIVTAREPDDLLRANVGFCQSVLTHCEEATPRVSGAMTKAAEPVVGFQLLPLPIRRNRDEVFIGDADAADHVARSRRVA